VTGWSRCCGTLFVPPTLLADISGLYQQLVRIQRSFFLIICT